MSLFIVQAIKYGESQDERTPSKLNYSLLLKSIYSEIKIRQLVSVEKNFFK